MKHFCLLVSVLLVLATTASAQNYYNTVTIKLFNAVTGEPLNCNDFIPYETYDNAGIYLYTPDYHEWYYADLLSQEDCSKVVFQNVYKGYYFLEFAGQPTASVALDNYQEVFYNGAPYESVATVISFTSSSNSTTKNLYLRPTTTNLSLSGTYLNTDASGNVIVSVYGSGFGNTKGWVDIGGKLTNSSTYLINWTDTQIDFKLPSTYKDPAYLAVCPKYYGCVKVYQN